MDEKLENCMEEFPHLLQIDIDYRGYEIAESSSPTSAGFQKITEDNLCELFYKNTSYEELAKLLLNLSSEELLSGITMDVGDLGKRL